MSRNIYFGSNSISQQMGQFSSGSVLTPIEKQIILEESKVDENENENE